MPKTRSWHFTPQAFVAAVKNGKISGGMIRVHSLSGNTHGPAWFEELCEDTDYIRVRETPEYTGESGVTVFLPKVKTISWQAA